MSRVFVRRIYPSVGGNPQTWERKCKENGFDPRQIFPAEWDSYREEFKIFKEDGERFWSSNLNIFERVPPNFKPIGEYG